MVLQKMDDRILDLKVPQDGVISAILSGKQVSIYDLIKQSLFFEFSGAGQELGFSGNCMDFGNRAGRLIMGSDSGAIDFLDLRQKGISASIKASENSVEKLSVHPFNDMLIVGDSLGCLKVNQIIYKLYRIKITCLHSFNQKLIDTRMNNVSHSLEAHKDSVSSVCFSPRGSHFFSNDRSGLSVLWKLNLPYSNSNESFDIDKMRKSISDSPKQEIKKVEKSKEKSFSTRTKELEEEVKKINLGLSTLQGDKENHLPFESNRGESAEVITSKELNKRLDQVESSILGIYKTLNLLEKMTEKNSVQLKHIIELCNKRDLE